MLRKLTKKKKRVSWKLKLKKIRKISQRLKRRFVLIIKERTKRISRKLVRITKKVFLTLKTLFSKIKIKKISKAKLKKGFKAIRRIVAKLRLRIKEFFMKRMKKKDERKEKRVARRKEKIKLKLKRKDKRNERIKERFEKRTKRKEKRKTKKSKLKIRFRKQRRTLIRLRKKLIRLYKKRRNKLSRKLRRVIKLRIKQANKLLKKTKRVSNQRLKRYYKLLRKRTRVVRKLIKQAGRKDKKKISLKGRFKKIRKVFARLKKKYTVVIKKYIKSISKKIVSITKKVFVSLKALFSKIKIKKISKVKLKKRIKSLLSLIAKFRLRIKEIFEQRKEKKDDKKKISKKEKLKTKSKTKKIKTTSGKKKEKLVTKSDSKSEKLKTKTKSKTKNKLKTKSKKKLKIKTLVQLLSRVERKPSKEFRKLRMKFEAKFLKALVMRLKKSTRPFHFVYFDQGFDKLPMLFINKKKISGSIIKIMRMVALKKQVIRGTIIWSKEKKAFIWITKGNNVGKLPRSLKVYFGRLVKQLKNSIVQTSKSSKKDSSKDSKSELSSKEIDKTLENATKDSFEKGTVEEKKKINLKEATGIDTVKLEGKETKKISETKEKVIDSGIHITKLPVLGPKTLPEPVKLSSSKTPKGVVDKISKANASELVVTLPQSGNVLDQKAQEESSTIGKTLPKIKADIDGVKDITEPSPVKEISVSDVKLKNVENPNQATSLSSNMQKDVSKQATKQKILLGKATNFKLDPVRMDATTDLKTKISGSIGVDTTLPLELQEYADADVESIVRQGADKEMQPLLTKSLGKIQTDVQKQEETRDKAKKEQLDQAQRKADKEERKARKEQESILAKPKEEAEKAKQDADSEIKGELAKLKKTGSSEAKQAEKEGKSRLKKDKSKADSELRKAEKKAKSEERKARNKAGKEKKKKKKKKGWFGKLVSKVVSGIKKAVNKIFAGLKKLVKKIRSAAKRLAKRIMAAGMKWIRKRLKNLSKRLKSFAKKAFKAIKTAAKFVRKAITVAVKFAKKQVIKLAKGLAKAVMIVVNTVVKTVKGIIQTAYFAIKGAIEVGKALLKGDFKGALKALFENALKAVGADDKTVTKLLQKAGGAIDNIFKKPIRFIKTLIKAIGEGFRMFKDNFLKHLKSGLQDWLFGTLAGAGLQLPNEFDLKGVFSIALQIFGISEKNVFSRVEKKIGKKNSDRVQLAWRTVKTAYKDGVEGLWALAQEQINSIHATIITQIMDWVKTKVIEKAFTKLAVLFIPFAGLVAAAKTLWDTIKFIQTKIKKFKQLGEAMLDVIAPAAKGDGAPAAKKVEQVMAHGLSLAIGA